MRGSGRAVHPKWKLLALRAVAGGVRQAHTSSLGRRECGSVGELHPPRALEQITRAGANNEEGEKNDDERQVPLNEIWSFVFLKFLRGYIVGPAVSRPGAPPVKHTLPLAPIGSLGIKLTPFVSPVQHHGAEINFEQEAGAIIPR